MPPLGLSQPARHADRADLLPPLRPDDRHNAAPRPLPGLLGDPVNDLDHAPACNTPTPTVATTIILGRPYLFTRCPDCGAQALDPVDPQDPT
jgi:hypothetical protein